MDQATSCRGAKVSGGVSNISFSFRGNNVVREAMHSAFLYHAIKAGLDMGIVNAGQLAVYEEIPKDLLELVEDVLLNRRPDCHRAAGDLCGNGQADRTRRVVKDDEWRKGTVEERLSHALVKGITDYIDQDTKKRGRSIAKPLDGDRRSADGRNEHRGRSVRIGQDVSAAGREKRPCDEEGRRLSAAVHGRREETDGRVPDHKAGSCSPR